MFTSITGNRPYARVSTSEGSYNFTAALAAVRHLPWYLVDAIDVDSIDALERALRERDAMEEEEWSYQDDDLFEWADNIEMSGRDYKSR